MERIKYLKMDELSQAIFISATQPAEASVAHMHVTAPTGWPTGDWG